MRDLRATHLANLASSLAEPATERVRPLAPSSDVLLDWNRPSIQEFAQARRGTLIRRGDPACDAARSVSNAVIDRYPALQSVFDPFCPSVRQWYWRADFFRELPDEAIEQHLRFGSKISTILSGTHLYPIDGSPAS